MICLPDFRTFLEKKLLREKRFEVFFPWENSCLPLLCESFLSSGWWGAKNIQEFPRKKNAQHQQSERICHFNFGESHTFNLFRDFRRSFRSFSFERDLFTATLSGVLSRVESDLTRNSVWGWMKTLFVPWRKEIRLRRELV